MASNAFGRDEMSIQLYVQEPPEFPRNLHVIEKHSRTATLGWILSQDGNSPIKHYVIEYKMASELWMEQQTEHLMVPGNQAMASVGPLKPSTTYQFRLFAENDLGRSQSSDVLDVITDGEPPTGPPTKIHVAAKSSVALQVSWLPPAREFWNGDILGYHVGYREARHTQEKIQFVTVEGQYPQGAECTIKQLKKFTKYNVQVQAFNALGPGPMSTDVPCSTKEDVPSAPPQEVRCTALSSQSVQVHWEPPPESQVHGILKGYKVVWESAEVLNELIKPNSHSVTALTYSIYNLERYTNYSIQVLAFTVVGDGVLSDPFYCLTEEDVPGSPAAIKAIPKSPTSIVVSWRPPSRPNGIIITYNVYVRVLNSNGIEIKTYKRNISYQQTYYEAEDLNKRAQYEFSVTAITKVGEGPKSTSVIQTTHTEARVKTEIYTYSQDYFIPKGQDMFLPCRAVGKPEPSFNWSLWTLPVIVSDRIQQFNNEGIAVQNLSKEDDGNYTCFADNGHSKDQIIHIVTVQVPPDAPLLHAIGATTDTISIQWKQGDNGGDYVRGFEIYKKCNNSARSNGEWEETRVGYRERSKVLENLWCGSQYLIYLKTFNNIGVGPKSETITINTEGTKPGSVNQERLIFVNITSVNLYLMNWEDGGCPITRFEIKYKRRDDKEWFVDQNEIKLQNNYEIKNLLPATQYEMEIKAHNDAGMSVGEFKFQTLAMGGVKVEQVETTSDTKDNQVKDITKTPFYYDWWIIVCGLLFSLVGIMIGLVALYKCVTKKPSVTEDICLEETIVIRDNKNNCEQREHYYATVRKSMRSPVRDMTGSTLERIPENSEDIYPYATFELTEQPTEIRCTSAAPLPPPPPPMQSFVYHDQRMTAADTLQVRESDSDHYSKSKRSRRKSRSFKSESEEYDTLGSDSDTEQGTSSRTESSNHLDGPGPSRERSGSQPFTRRSRITHTTMFHGPESSTSTEPSPLYERRSFPRRGRPQMLQLASHSIETGRSGVSRDSSSSSFFFPAKLEPPTGFSDSIELSEAECDLDVARGLRMLQLDMRQPPSFRASKRRGNHQDFTIAV